MTPEPLYYVEDAGGKVTPVYEVDPCPEGDTLDEEAALICAISASSDESLPYEDVAEALGLSDVAVERAHAACIAVMDAYVMDAYILGGFDERPFCEDDAEAASALLSGIWP
jgi:hypothetical protein